MLISLYHIPTEAGGRKSHFPDTHNIDCALASEPDKHYMCRLYYRMGEFWEMLPLLPDQWPEVKLGDQFIFREGKRVVAVGAVTE